MKMRHHRFTNMTGTISIRGSESGGRYKSALERDAFIRYLMNPAVDSVQLQQPVIKWKNPERTQASRYTADLFIKWNNSALRPLAVEVKSKKELERNPELVRKFELIKAVFAEKGVDFKVMTEVEIRAAGIEMMRFVFGFRNHDQHPAEPDLLTVVRRHAPIDLGTLVSTVAGENIYTQATVVPAVWRLVSTHQLRVDFTGILDETAKVGLPPAI